MMNINKVLNSPELYIVIYSFLLNFIWEIYQLPLFAGFGEAIFYSTVLHCTRATLGDVVISLIAYALACLAARTREWILLRNTCGTIVFISTGLIITVVFEMLATGPLNRWAYADTMPLVPLLNIGVSPLLQWIILPVVQLWFVRRMLSGGLNVH